MFTVLVAAGGILCGLVAAWTIGKAIWRTVVKVNDVWELLTRELQPNGGGSTYDRIKQMNHSLHNQELLLALHMRDPKAHSRNAA